MQKDSDRELGGLHSTLIPGALTLQLLDLLPGQLLDHNGLRQHACKPWHQMITSLAGHRATCNHVAWVLQSLSLALVQLLTQYQWHMVTAPCRSGAPCAFTTITATSRAQLTVRRGVVRTLAPCSVATTPSTLHVPLTWQLSGLNTSRNSSTAQWNLREGAA